MKRITAIIITLALVLALCACANQETNNLQDQDIQVIAETESKVEVQEVEEDKELWTLDLDRTLSGPNGFSRELETYGNTIIFYNESRCLIMDHYERSISLVDSTTGEITSLSGNQKVIDYTVAYDTLYWFNLDREVWASSWDSEDFTAKLFCEDAIAVSPFTDECEGAIVSPEKANIDYGYGDLPIYSPYGIVD